MTPAPSPEERAALVAAAETSIARGSKSFAMASRLFDRATRERVWLLYAWCRRCDDLADGQDHGHGMRPTGDPAARLAQIRSLTAAAFAGAPTGDAAFDALGLVARETGLTPAMADAVIAGFALDAADWYPRTIADTLDYCWHVAGAVGVMMAVVMGVAPDDEEVLDRAADLGIAFQLANIARDAREDDAAGRCYLPADWLAEADIPPGEQLRPCYRDRLAMVARRLCDLAERYEASARVGAGRLRPRCRWAVLAAAGIYGDIARLVRARGERAWHARASTTPVAKLGWVARAGWQSLRPLRWDERETLPWRRPREEACVGIAPPLQARGWGGARAQSGALALVSAPCPSPEGEG